MARSVKKVSRRAAGVAVLILGIAACGSSSSSSTPTTVAPAGGTSPVTTSTSGSSAALTASAPGVTPTTIKIGLVAPLTGVSSSSSVDSTAFAQARIDLQNSQGGVDGRKLQLVSADDQSTTANDLTAVQNLVETDKVFGVVSNTPFLFGGYRYLQQQNVPVTGAGYDGPEWGNLANMFTYDAPTYTSYNGKLFSYTTDAKLLKAQGATKLAILSYGDSPSATASAKEQVAADTQEGIANCYENLSVPFGAQDFGADVLAIQHAGCDAVEGVFVEASNVSLSAALHNAGYKGIQFYDTSYDAASLATSGVRTDLNNSYSYGLVPTTPAAQAFLAAVHKYVPSFTGSIPSFNELVSWEATDVMIKGLQLAGQNPTRAAFISNLRTVTNYTLGGLSPSPISFDYLTGKLAPTECNTFVKLDVDKFVPVPADGSPTCGTLVSINS
jgi:branched-chain amino acid transport system substrate-binding protein